MEIDGKKVLISFFLNKKLKIETRMKQNAYALYARVQFMRSNTKIRVRSMYYEPYLTDGDFDKFVKNNYSKDKLDKKLIVSNHITALILKKRLLYFEVLKYQYFRYKDDFTFNNYSDVLKTLELEVSYVLRSILINELDKFNLENISISQFDSEAHHITYHDYHFVRWLNALSGENIQQEKESEFAPPSTAKFNIVGELKERVLATIPDYLIDYFEAVLCYNNFCLSHKFNENGSYLSTKHSTYKPDILGNVYNWTLGNEKDMFNNYTKEAKDISDGVENFSLSMLMARTFGFFLNFENHDIYSFELAKLFFPKKDKIDLYIKLIDNQILSLDGIDKIKMKAK